MKKNGFTLAETLITLGIIGVVASITIPTLIQNYQKQVWVAQLQKTASSFQNDIKMTNISEGVDNIFDSSLAKVYKRSLKGFNPDTNSYFDYYILESVELDTEKLAELLKYETASDSYNINFAGEQEEFFFPYKLKNGARFMFQLFGYGSTTIDGYGIGYIIDVNGPKGPNQIGRDIIELAFQGDGRIVTEDFNNSEEEEKFRKACGGNIDSLNALGDINLPLACGNKIVRDGWKMNY